MKYQRANNLSVDGIVGDETWGSIYSKKKKREEDALSKNSYLDVWRQKYNPFKENKAEYGEDFHERVRKGWESRTLPERKAGFTEVKAQKDAFLVAPPPMPERYIAKAESPKEAEGYTSNSRGDYYLFDEKDFSNNELFSNTAGGKKTQTESRDAGEEKDWFGTFVSEPFRIAEEEELVKHKVVNNLSKEAQREFWRHGAKVALRNCPVSAYMLEHSLKDNPTAMVRGNESDIAELIKKDPVYLNALDKAIEESDGKTIDTDLKDIAFNTPDLYYSIHKATIHVKGYKNKEGKWIINAMLDDTYDFTEWMSVNIKDGGLTFDIRKGTVANDMAVISQSLGAINPYKIKVYFNTVR